MTTDAMLIDCDGHILEPPDLWEKYLEPRYRDRAIRIRVGDDGYEYLEIDGKRALLPRPGQLGNLGGMGKRVDEARAAARARHARRDPSRGDAGDPPGPRAHVPAGRGVRHHGHEGARRAPRSRGHGQGDPLPDDRAAVGSRVMRPGALGGVLPRVQPVDRRFLPRLRRAVDPHRAPVAGRSRRGGRRSSSARSRTAAAAPSCARSRSRASPTETPGTTRLRRRAGPRRAARDSSDVRAARLGDSPSLRQVRLGGVVLRSLRRPGRPARLRDALPARRLRPLPPPARRRAGVAGRLDRLLPGPRGRHLRRNHARRHRSPGEAVALFQAPVLHLGRSGRAHDRRA